MSDDINNYIIANCHQLIFLTLLFSIIFILQSFYVIFDLQDGYLITLTKIDDCNLSQI